MSERRSPGVYISTEAQPIRRRLAASPTTIAIVGWAKQGPVNTPTLVTTKEEFIAKFGEPLHNVHCGFAAVKILEKASRVYFVRADQAPESDELMGSIDNELQKMKDALATLEDSEAFDVDIILVPNYPVDGFVDGDEESPNIGTAVTIAAVNVAKIRGSCRVFSDILPYHPDSPSENPKPVKPEDVKDYVTPNLKAKELALFYPFCLLYNEYKEKEEAFPISALVAAMATVNDARNAPWFALAGLVRGKIDYPIRLPFSINQSQRNDLYTPLSEDSEYSVPVNPVINYRGQGIVIFGNKVASNDDSDIEQALNVSRLKDYLIKNITVRSDSLVFEQSDVYLRDQWIDLHTPLFESVKSRRGLIEYRIIADSSNNTQEDLASGRLNVTILIRPTRAAEFLEITLRVTPEGIEIGG